MFGGMGGSASIQSKSQNIFGHDGLMGSHGPIAVGMCYGNKSLLCALLETQLLKTIF